MTKNKQQNIVNPTAINWIIFLVGLVLIFLGLVLDIGSVSSKSMSIVSVSVGSSLVASSIILSISTKLIVKQASYYDMLNRWGLERIYRTRSEMNTHADETFISLKNNLDMIGFGLHAFRVSKGKEIEKKARDGLNIRILTIHPYSPFVLQREKDEQGVPGQISKTILDLEAWVKELKSISPVPSKINIRYYNNLPLESYYRQDGYIYTGPFLYGMPSQKTISYVYKENSEGFNYWSNYFETVWNDNSLTSDDYQTIQTPSFLSDSPKPE